LTAALGAHSPFLMAHQQKNRRKRKDPAIERKADDLVESTGISRALAMQVVLGRVELNEVLTRMAHKAEVESLMRRYDLSRALATQITLGQADLDSVLFKRRMAQHLSDNADRSVLVQAALDGKPVSLALHGQRGVDGTVLGVDRYEFQFKPRTGDEETVHKLQAKFAVDATLRKKVRKSLSYDKERRAAGDVEPVWKPQDRYTCSNKRLFTFQDQKTPVQASLLEGEVLRGVVTWVGRYEFGLEVKGGVEVVVFRHALANLTPA